MGPPVTFDSISPTELPTGVSAPKLPTLGGRWELLREIARGGACLVYEARHVVTGRTVAAKLLIPERRRDHTHKQRLLREARATTDARHPCVVDVLDAGECPEVGAFMVLEMLEGRPLDGLLASRGRLPFDQTLNLASQLLGAVAHLHTRGIVHRDIKPSNVFVSRDASGLETVKLLDLGVAASSGPQERKLTLADELLGTPEYMAPEQLLAQPGVGARSDVYAVGVTLFECLTGSVPYGGSYPEVLMQVAQQKARPKLSELRPDVPPAFAASIEAALAYDALARPESARALATALVSTSGLRPARTQLLTNPAAPPPLPAAKPAATNTKSAAKSPVEAVLAAAMANAPRMEAAIDPRARRRFARAPYVTQVRLVLADGTMIDGRSEDVSEGGLLVLTEAGCPENAQVEVRFALPIEGRVLRVNGKTRWVRAARGLTAVGVELEGLDGKAREMVRRYVELMGNGS